MEWFDAAWTLAISREPNHWKDAWGGGPETLVARLEQAGNFELPVFEEPENDPARFEPYAGLKRRFLAIAPWVIRSGDRDRLRATSEKLATGSGDPIENDYVETAVIADLPFPVERNRPGCLRAG
jgi:hypothetical protein